MVNKILHRTKNKIEQNEPNSYTQWSTKYYTETKTRLSHTNPTKYYTEPKTKLNNTNPTKTRGMKSCAPVGCSALASMLAPVVLFWLKPMNEEWIGL